MIKIEAAHRLLASEYPKDKQRIEFLSDKFTDKGPATGIITKSFVTVDGPYITVKFSDAQETFSWDDISDKAKLKNDLWLIN